MAHEIDEEISRLIDDAHQRAAQVLLDHQQALHEIAAILIEHETIEKEQFERLLRGEPQQTVIAPEAAPGQANPKPPRKPARKPRPSRAQPAKPVRGAAAARAVRREDRIDAASTRPLSQNAPSSSVGIAGGKETT
jgi:hypothetical protein